MNVTEGTQRRSGFINNYNTQKPHELGESGALLSMNSLQCKSQHLQKSLEPVEFPIAAWVAAPRVSDTGSNPAGAGSLRRAWTQPSAGRDARSSHPKMQTNGVGER